MGERVFSYRNLATFGYALMTLPLILFPLGPLWFIARSGTPAFDILLPLVGIGIVGLYFTAKHFLSWANERIVLTADEIIWYDSLGRPAVRSPLGGIAKGSLTSGVALTASTGGYQRSQRQWQVDTVAGRIRFRSIISNSRELVHELESHGAAGDWTPGHGTPLVCNYHTWPMALGMFVGLILLCACSFAVASMIVNPPIDANTHQPEPIWFPLIFAGAGVGMAFFFAFCALCFVNERISIVGDQIEWRDKLGRIRARCSSADVTPGGFSSRIIYNRNSTSTVYRVETRVGVIKFDQNISDADVLADRFQHLSEGKPNAGPDPKAGWSSDPLQDPDQHNIPIN